MSFKLTLSLPPSTNKRLIRSKSTSFFILSTSARDWLESATQEVWAFVVNNRIQKFQDFFYLDLNFYLKRKGSDNHNYFKLLFDALERGGLVENDCYIMPRVQSVSFDKVNPRVEITWSSTTNVPKTSQT